MTALPLQLSVNVDHVATLRQARRIDYPDPVEAAAVAEAAGACATSASRRPSRCWGRCAPGSSCGHCGSSAGGQRKKAIILIATSACKSSASRYFY